MKFNPKHHQLRAAVVFVRGPVQAKAGDVLTPEQADTMTAETIADEVTFGRLTIEDLPAAEEPKPDAAQAGGGEAAGGVSDPEPDAGKATAKARGK